MELRHFSKNVLWSCIRKGFMVSITLKFLTYLKNIKLKII